MVIRLSVSFLLLILWLPLKAQERWHQQVDYTIDVRLDDRNHYLHGQWAMTYTNNSPDTLQKLYMHLWPNAYSSGETALAQQQLEMGNTALYYAENELRGWIDSLDFKQEGKACTLSETVHHDVAILYLTNPIPPHQSATFTTPFRVKIPGDFSRLGHDGNAYQISQWYPKPAVYDQKGWHPMPYLDQGEFYSEFGDFTVRITLPENYVVGATGELQNEDERKWLLTKADSLDHFLKQIEYYEEAFPPSASGSKTLEYRAENVHDFAWFADKRYLVDHDTTSINNQVVDLWAFFTPDYSMQWEKATTYIKRGLQFYSKTVGPYEYPQCTAVEGTLSAGAGMEYPMITIVGSSDFNLALERVIVHEVGHNWFYGMLASNERLYPWMDEGINSYYEYRYFQTQYPNRRILPEEAEERGINAFGLGGMREQDLYRKLWTHQYLVHENQQLNLQATDYTSINYGIGVYGGIAFLLEHVAAYLGQETFDRAMQMYFQEWKGRHPYPEDFLEGFQEQTDKSWDWAFNGQLAEAKRQNFGFGKVEDRNDTWLVETRDVTNSGAPYPVQVIVEDTVYSEYWVQGDTTISVPKVVAAQHLAIDHHRVTLDLNRGNNTYRFTGLFKKSRKPALRWLVGLEQDDIQATYYTPVAGWNNYDRWMVGAAFYNSLFPQRSFHYRLAPMFGFGSNSVVGAATLEQDIFFKKGLFHHWQLGVSGQTFHDDIVRGNWLLYSKVNPRLTLHFRKPSATSTSEHTLKMESNHIDRERLQFQSASEFTMVHQRYNYQRLTYEWERETTLSPFTQTVALERHDKYLKAWWDGRWRISNNFLNGDIRIRTFAGAFLSNRLNEPWENIFQFSLSNTTGRLDYGYENLYLGRTDQTGATYRQQYIGGGGIKVPTDKFPFGTSGSYLASVNATMPLPIPLIALFGDLALMPVDGKAQWFSEAGVALIIAHETMEIYLPIFMDQNLRQAFVNNGQNYFQRITFVLNLNRLNPLKTIRSISLNDLQ